MDMALSDPSKDVGAKTPISRIAHDSVSSSIVVVEVYQAVANDNNNDDDDRRRIPKLAFKVPDKMGETKMSC